MAEVFGIVANGLAVVEIAARIGSGAFKLKKIWEEVKEVPQAILDLVDEIDMLNPFISELEADNSLGLVDLASHADPSARRSVEYCRRALDEMAKITGELTAQIYSSRRSRRGLSKVKIVLKKDVSANYENRLRRVVSMLGLAQQHYLM